MTEFQAGFQGSETSRAEVTIYTHGGGEPGRADSPEIIELFGSGADPVLTRLETHKTLGTPAGSFSFDVKTHNPDFVRSIGDDDWVDIVLTKFGVRTHVMRGQIEYVKRVRTTNENGATVTTYRIGGRDFGRIFDMTPIWFDPISESEQIAGFMADVFDAIDNFRSDAASTVETILSGFLKMLSSDTAAPRGNWELPPSMPTFTSNADPFAEPILVSGEANTSSVLIPTDGAELEDFLEMVTFFSKDFVNWPPRASLIDAHIYTIVNASGWSFANEWADLPLCELFTDLISGRGRTSGRHEYEQPSADNPVPTGTVVVKSTVIVGVDQDGVPIQADQKGFPRSVQGADYAPAVQYGGLTTDVEFELTPDTSVPAVIFRDRPFPTFNRCNENGEEEDIRDGPWFNGRIPTYEVAQEEITSLDVGKGGGERRNAFSLSPRSFLPEHAHILLTLQKPLWNPDDMRRHSLRKQDFETRYIPNTGSESDWLDMYESYLQRLRDFHCMNHLFLNGTVELGFGRPDIRIGGKFHIQHSDPDQVETYYVEGVHHFWMYEPGVKTTLDITRGWIGTDDSYIETLSEIVESYRRPGPEDGLDEPQPEATGPPPTEDDDDFTKHATRVIPFSLQFNQVFGQAALAAGLPASWGDATTPEGHDVSWIMAKESNGYVGRPNEPSYGERARKFTEWKKIWQEIATGGGIPFPLQQSHACGLGQLQPENMDRFMPIGRGGLGSAYQEAVGMLKYIEDQYGTPQEARAKYGKEKGGGY